MKSHKISDMKLVLFLTLINLESIFAQNSLSCFIDIKSCNTKEHVQFSLSEFIKTTVSLHFSECYGIQIQFQPKKKTQAYSHVKWEIAAIQLDYSRTDSTRSMQGLYSNEIFSLARFRKQCIVIEVIMNGATPSKEITDTLLSIQLQKRGMDSYIFVNEYTKFEAANEFLVEPLLKNFPNRVWTEFVPLDFYNVDDLTQEKYGFTFNHFCLYCNSGKSAIENQGKIYKSAAEITKIHDIFPDATSNLHGHTLRVTAPPAPPLVLITPSKTNPKKNGIQGQQKNILYSIAEKYNFSCHLYSVPGGSTGSKLPNGTWNGVMGEVLYGRADIGLTVATAYDRREIAEFTVPVFYAFLVLVSTKPIPVFEWQSIFYPFKTSAWLALIVITVLTLYLYKFLHNRSLVMEVHTRKLWKSKLLLLQEIKSDMMTWFRAFYMTVGSFLEQGIPKDFNTIPSRIIAAFWGMTSIIIITAYRSKLFSFLISPTIEIPPSSFGELATSDDYTWGMKSLGGIALLFITQSPLKYIQKIGENMDIYTDKYTCLDKTFHGKFTCIIYRAYIDYMMEVRYWKIKHQFYISDFVTPPVGSAWAITRHSPLKQNFDTMLYRIYEMGLADKYLVDYQVSFAKVARAIAQASNQTEDTFTINTGFKNDDDSGPKPLEMANLYGGFFILGIGAAFSIMMLGFEVVKHQRVVAKQRLYWTMIRARIRHFRNRNESKKVSFRQVATLFIPSEPRPTIRLKLPPRIQIRYY